MIEQTESVVRAGQVLRQLESHRVSLQAKADSISAARKEIGYRAFADGDKSARKRLDEMNLESATISGSLEAVEAAIQEAESRFNLAKADAAKAADQEKAKKLDVVVKRAVERAHKVDEFLEKAIAEANALNRDIAEMRQFGAEISHAMLLTNVDLALRSALMGFPGSWARDFGVVAPAMRRSFGQFFVAMTSGIERDICRRLGEAQDKPNEEAA
jgi:hypothetical protein